MLESWLNFCYIYTCIEGLLFALDSPTYLCNTLVSLHLLNFTYLIILCILIVFTYLVCCNILVCVRVRVYVCICMCVCIWVHIYIYIYIERERERDVFVCIHVLEPLMYYIF